MCIVVAVAVAPSLSKVDSRGRGAAGQGSSCQLASVMMRASRWRSGSAALLLLLAALCGAVQVSSADDAASGTDPSLLLASEDSSSLFYGLSLDNVVEPPPSPPPLPSPPPYDVHMHEIVEDVRVEFGDSFYGQGLESYRKREGRFCVYKEAPGFRPVPCLP